ncbi:MAG: type II toxin-antitoxin system HicA family toxin [Gemmatimonadaceae bacterium]
MKAVSGKDFARLLETHGWGLKHVTGSHHIYCKAGDIARISVPVHGNRTLKIGLQRHLMKVAGLTETDL